MYYLPLWNKTYHLWNKLTIYGTRTYKRVTHMITCYVIMTRSACHFDKDFMALHQRPALLRQTIMPI